MHWSMGDPSLEALESWSEGCLLISVAVHFKFLALSWNPPFNGQSGHQVEASCSAPYILMSSQLGLFYFSIGTGLWTELKALHRALECCISARHTMLLVECDLKLLVDLVLRKSAWPWRFVIFCRVFCQMLGSVNGQLTDVFREVIKCCCGYFGEIIIIKKENNSFSI